MARRTHRNGPAKLKKTEARSKYAAVMAQRQLHHRDVRYITIRDWFATRSSWHVLRALHRVRLRWQWLMAIALFVSAVCWVAGADFFGHVSMGLAVEQVLHHLGERAIAFVEEI
jgi:hypothetical protein